MHSYIPQSTETLETRQYSAATEFKVQKVTTGDTALSLDEIRLLFVSMYR